MSVLKDKDAQASKGFGSPTTCFLVLPSRVVSKVVTLTFDSGCGKISILKHTCPPSREGNDQ